MYMYVLWGIRVVKSLHETSILFFFFSSHAINLVMILHHDYHVTLQIM